MTDLLHIYQLSQDTSFYLHLTLGLARVCMLVYNITATRSTPRTLFLTSHSEQVQLGLGWTSERDELAHQSGANWSILLSVGKFEAYIGDTETSTSKN